jgi:hypothetical protein
MDDTPLPEAGHQDADDQTEVDAVVAKGPTGAFAVVGLATALVVALWFAFYLLAYLPRGTMQ